MYRRILDYFVGAPTEDAAQVKKADDNKIAELTARIQQLETELKVRTRERDALKEELEKLAAHAGSTISTGVGEGSVTTCDKPSQQNDDSQLQKENQDLRSALSKKDELLKDKTELCTNHERQNVALTTQVASLKEVVAITKDLLNIRNMEVEHLQSDMESMETKINAERSRHKDLLQKMDEAANINAKLKSEYQTQLKIFQDLKEKYEEKVGALTKQKDELQKEVLSAVKSVMPQNVLPSAPKPVASPKAKQKQINKQSETASKSEDEDQLSAAKSVMPQNVLPSAPKPVASPKATQKQTETASKSEDEDQD